MTEELFLKLYMKAWNYATDKVGKDSRCWSDLLANKFCYLLEEEQKSRPNV